MDRRSALGALLAAAASPATLHAQASTDTVGSLADAVRQAGQINPGRSAAALELEGKSAAAERHAHAAEQVLFVGSAVKTFMLAQYLLDVESGRLSLDTPCEIGPHIWSPGSKVFQNLQGTVPAGSVLEAMIAHSDNTATDSVLQAVGADRVRALLREVGLVNTRIPDSTRRLFSYLAGAPAGTDLGWDGMKEMMQGTLPFQPRPAINEVQTMVSTATEMIQWYRKVLSGGLFRTSEMLREFKRISAMADAISASAPDDILGYGKGGSIEWDGFNCFALAGQLVLGKERATFCFVVNWNGGTPTVAPMFQNFVQRARHCLALAQERSEQRLV